MRKLTHQTDQLRKLVRMRKLAHMTFMTQGNGAVIPQWTVEDRFRKARELRGLSQQEFADEVGLSRRIVSTIESGLKKPAKRDYLLWQMATGVPRAWLETGQAPDDDPTPGGTGVHPPGLEPGTH